MQRLRRFRRPCSPLRAIMTDSSSSRRDASLPPATIYDPHEEVSTPFGTAPLGAVVLLLVGDVERRWAADTAVELCGGVGGQRTPGGARRSPPGEPPAPATSSRARTARASSTSSSTAPPSPAARHSVAGRGFFFIPAGTYTPDVEAVYRNPRWPKLVAGFREAGASLVLLAPAAGADLAGARALGHPDDPARHARGGRGPRHPARPGARAARPADAARARVDRPGARRGPPHPAPRRLRRPCPPRAAARGARRRRRRRPTTTRRRLRSRRAGRRRPATAPPPPPAPRSRRAARSTNFVLWFLLAVVLLATAGYLVGRLRPDLAPLAARRHAAARGPSAEHARRRARGAAAAPASRCPTRCR